MNILLRITKKKIDFSIHLEIIVLTLIFLFSMGGLYSQTTVLSWSGDGGFETGTTFAANGWTATTGTATQNQWVCNTGATGYTGSRCAYITNNTGTVPPPNTYTVGNNRVSHLYRNITVPSGQGDIRLSFNYKSYGEGTYGSTNYDYLSVWLVPTTVTPAYGTSLAASGSAPTGNILLLSPLSLQTNVTSCAAYIPAAYAGQTFRIVFQWQNDNSTGTAPSGMIDNVSITSRAAAALTSTTLVPSTGSNSITCSSYLQDNGGTGNYSSSIDGYTAVMVGEPSNVISFFGPSSSESGYDYLYIYQGVGTGGTLVYQASGINGVNFSGTAGQSYTVRFSADGGTVGPGFDIRVDIAGTMGCSIGLESAAVTAPTGCTAGTIPVGSGAYKDVVLTANTYYDFTWANNSGNTTNGFCASILSGGAGATSSSFSTNQSAWFSGSTAPTLRVSASRSSSCWSATSAVMTYKHTTPTLGTPSNAGPITFCDASGDFITPVTVSGAANGTVVWDWGSNNGTWNNNWVNTTSGTAYFYKKLSNSDGNADRMRYRVSNNGCDVTSATILNTNKYNEAPSSLASSTTSWCSSSPPANITLTATFPANINKNGVVAFYSGSCGGTLVGSVTAGDNTTTAAVTIATPGSTTTYYARYEPGTGSSCSNTACASTTVTIGSPSTAPTGIAGAGVTICHGNSVSLSQSGGALSTGASYEWFSGSCGGTGAGSGTSISVSPTATTTYYVRASAGTYCPASTCASGTITLPTAGTSLATNGQSATCNVSGSGWIHFYTSGGNLIASINPNGNNLGSVTATAYVSGSPIMTQACGTGSNPSFTTAALGRSWVITPTNNLAASVRFPFSATELAGLVTSSVSSTVSNALDNISGLGDLKMSHYSGVNQNASWSDNCTSAGGSGGTQLVGTQGGSGLTSTGNGFVSTVTGSSYVQFNTPGFSEFWLHGDGGSSPLPVELTNFSATCNEQYQVDVNWSTASETNSQKFVVQRSRDLENWTYVSDRNASGNSNYKIDYFAADESPLGGISYYRLVQVDNDGVERIYGPISVSCADAENSMIIFPNPTKGAFTVEVASSENISNAQIQLTDLTGKVITTRSVNIQQGNNQLLFEGIDLQLGTYIVRVVSKPEFKPARVVVN